MKKRSYFHQWFINNDPIPIYSHKITSGLFPTKSWQNFSWNFLKPWTEECLAHAKRLPPVKNCLANLTRLFLRWRERETNSCVLTGRLVDVNDIDSDSHVEATMLAARVGNVSCCDVINYALGPDKPYHVRRAHQNQFVPGLRVRTWYVLRAHESPKLRYQYQAVKVWFSNGLVYTITKLLCYIEPGRIDTERSDIRRMSKN